MNLSIPKHYQVHLIIMYVPNVFRFSTHQDFWFEGRIYSVLKSERFCFEDNDLSTS